MLAGLLMAAGAPTAFAQCQVTQLAELPVSMETGRPVIDAKINGADVRLMLDSGAFWSALSYAKADELKLPTRPLPLGASIKGVTGSAKAKLARVDVFTLANTPLKNADFLVTSSPGAVAGVLGQNILSLMDIEYDFPHGFVRFFHVEKCNDKALAYWAKERPFSTIDLPRERGIRQSTETDAFINGKRVKAIVDTGASTVLDRQAAIRAGINMTSPDVVSGGLVYGVGGSSRPAWLAPIASFKIGDEEVKNAKLRIADLEVDDMLLGSDFLVSHRMLVSNSQSKAYFTYEGGSIFNTSPKSYVQGADGSLQESTAIADAEPTDADGFARRGSLRLAERKMDAALADFTKAIGLAPETASYYQLRARVYLQTRQPALAMSDLDRAISLNASFAEAFADRARLKLQLADKPGALADAASASQASPKQADLRFSLASVYDSAGRPDQAIEQYTLWIGSHPEDARVATALNGRCWTRALANVELDDALKDCSRAIALNPKTAAFLDSRGLVQVRRGAFKEAVSDYNAALAISPKSAWSLFGRSLAYRGLGQVAAADTDRSAAIQAQPTIVEEAAAYGLTG